MIDVRIVIGICIIVIIILVWKLKQNKEISTNLLKELKFFKKEKEYYNEAMFLFSSDYKIIYANAAARKLFLLDRKDNEYVSDKNILLTLHNGNTEDFFLTLKKLNTTVEKNIKLDNVNISIGSKKYNISFYLDKYAWDINKTLTCVIDLNVENNTISTEKEGSRDILTGLPNQFLALSNINTLVRNCKNKSEDFAIFLLGIDHFKDIQTTLGLGYTNLILKSLSKYFINNPSENIKLYRMESDKFLFVAQYADDDAIYQIAKDIIISVGNIFRDNNNIRLSSSIGIARYPKDGENASKLIDNVYIALSKAEDESESNIKLFNTEYQIVHQDEIKMNEEIKTGLLKNQFVLYYQPIFDFDGEVIIGAEALLRWIHPDHGVIAADKFLDVAKKTGLIVDLGEYVFEEAIRQRKRCMQRFDKNFKITINISLKEMNIEKLLPRLDLLFEKYEISRDTINLDINENIAMDNIERTMNDFILLKEFGLSLSLEHVGAGYSSFKYLSLLPLDTIKIDRSLIFDLTLNLNHQTTVQSIIDLAHTLGYKVIAEGVETSKEASILKALKCDYAQGYLYSRPLPEKEFTSLVN